MPPRPALLLAFFVLAGAWACNGPPPWQVVTPDADGWMLSVAAGAAMGDRVLVAGGAPAGPGKVGQGWLTRLRGTGGQPERLMSPRGGVLWWVHALSDRVAWAAGEDGTVLRYQEGAALELRAFATPSAAVLYGVWAFSDDDVWAVGGDEGRVGVVLHGGRGGFGIDASAPRTATLYKIYGADPQHLFMVGMGGTLLRRVDGAYHLDPPLTPLSEQLLTVHGRSEKDVWAVGGSRVLHFDGQAWSLVTAPDLGGLNGVHAGPADVLVSGQHGLLATGADGASFSLLDPATELDLHAVFVTETGAQRYAAGGNLSQFGIRPPRGVLLRQGP